MEQSMIVQRAKYEDLEALSILFDEYRQFYGSSSNPMLSYQFLKQRFTNQQSVIFIHIKDSTLTGFILLYLGFSTVACSTCYTLDNVYVRPKFRRQGIAKQLIDTAILFATNENALQISLEIQRNNTPAHQLYKAMGFIKDDLFQSYHCFLK